MKLLNTRSTLPSASGRRIASAPSAKNGRNQERRAAAARSIPGAESTASTQALG